MDEKVSSDKKSIDFPILQSQPLFIQYLNPEILNLYGLSSHLTTRKFFRTCLQITRYGFLICRDILFIPGSYIFEVPIIYQFLKSVAPLSRRGFFQIASPTPKLKIFAVKKRKEYRDERLLFPDYFSDFDPHGGELDTFYWLPRVERSAAEDITFEWETQLFRKGFWYDVIKKRVGKFSPTSKWETAIETVPERLDGRAFITRYAQSLLPFDLDALENTQLEMMISKAYLESYLTEYNAFILKNTPLGLLDCGISDYKKDGTLQTLPMPPIIDFFNFLGVNHLIENNLGWLQILELRSKPIIQWGIDAIIADVVYASKPFQQALLFSRYQKPDKAPVLNGKDAIFEIESRLWRLFDKVNYFFSNVINELFEYDRLIYPSLTVTSMLRKKINVVPEQIDIFHKDKGGSTMTNNTVFIVHGRDSKVVNSLRAILRAADLKPLDWDEVVELTKTPSPQTLDVIKLGISKSQAILIVLTPDEKVELRPELSKKSDTAEQNTGYQPRPNVLIEIGMAVAISSERTILLHVGNTRSISDISGLNYATFDGSASSSLSDLLMKFSVHFARHFKNDLLNGENIHEKSLLTILYCMLSLTKGFTFILS